MGQMRKIYEIKDRRKLEKYIKKEGNYKIFKYKDFECRIIRPHYIRYRKNKENIISLCGYVALPRKNKFYGITLKSNLLDELSVHGGITFTDDTILQKNNTFKKFTYLWWVGFDCCHCFDICQNSEFLKEMRNKMRNKMPNKLLKGIFGDINRSYKTMHYVERELKKLVNQIIKLNEENDKKTK